MKKHPEDQTPSNTQQSPELATELTGLDAQENHDLWQLLNEASSPESSPFFARNVMREVRALESEKPSLGTRLRGFFSPPRMAIASATAACVCAIFTYSFWPSNNQTNSGVVTATTESTQTSNTEMPELADLVIEETLDAAAEDPTIFTRDEVVAMLGL